MDFKIFAYFLAFLILNGCTWSKGFVDYKDLGVYASDSAGSKKLEDVGPVSADTTTWVWASCDTVATATVRELLDIARTRGANTVYKITFDSKDGRVTTPTCVKRWGWFAAWIVGGLGPWMTASAAEGIAAKITDGAGQKGAIYIPADADTQKLAEEFVKNLIQL